MKRAYLFSPLLILLLLAGALMPAGSTPKVAAEAPSAGPPWYVRGDFNAWGTDLMYDDGTHGDDVAGDNIHTVVLTITTAGRYEFKVDDGSWTDSHPPSNAWIETSVADEPVKFTFDTNTYADGWAPSTLIVNAQDSVATWTAVGDWQGWDPSDPATALIPLGDGMYAYTTTIATAGTHQYKVVRTGLWDAIGPQGGEGGRSINTDNLDFDTHVTDQPVLFLADVGTGRIDVRVQPPAVVINEFAAKGTEWIELYNPTATTVDLTNWYVSDGEGNETIAGTLPPGGYLSWNTVLGLDNSGDEVMLYDSNDTLVDEVAYGTHGGAPIEPTGDSVARTPNGYDSDDFARDWNLDQDPTRDLPNDAPPVALGGSLVVNEMSNYTPPANDAMELFNPTGADVLLDGWWICDGDGWGQLITTSVVPAGGWFTFNPNNLGMYFSSADVAYLFLPDGTRVDQIGWDGEYEDLAFQRICDGWGPNDGYDWDSSGGDLTWFDLPHTLGYTNSHSNCAPFDLDAGIAKYGPPAGLQPGDRFTYTLSFSMTTIRPATDVWITDTLPAEVTFYTFSSGLPVTWTGSVSPVIFQVDTLYGLQLNQIDLVVDVMTDVLPGTQLVNNVEISASGDMTLTNNMAVFTSTIGGSEVAIDKTGQAFAFPGDVISYTVTYQIQGDPAENVVITDTLPDDVAYVSDTAPVVPTEPSPGTFVWSLGTVTETESFHLYVQVDPDPLTTTLHNQIWISALTDTLSENNYDDWDTVLPTPIYDIQYTEDPGDGTYPSPHLGEYLYTAGVVVGVYPPTGGHVRFVLADPWDYGPWQGLYVYAEDTVIPSVSEGQLLLLGGTVYEYYGLTEFLEPDVYVVLSDTWPLPAPVLTTTAVITTASPATAEPLESVLLQVQGTQVTNDDLGYGEWGITDWTGVEARVGDLGDYTYVPQLGDWLNVRGILWYDFNDYKIEPRYDPDIEQIYPLSLVYHDQEDVVGMGEAVYVAGEFNGWDPLANPLTPNGDASVFDTILTLDMTGTYEYKYVVYTDTTPSGPAQWDWLNTGNREVIVDGSTEVDDYRAVDVGYAHLMEPAAVTITLGDTTGPITGEVYIQNVTDPLGEGRAVMAELGYGSDTDPVNWDWVPLIFTGQQNGNNDIYSASLTPTAAGVYSYAVRFDGNWGLDNPNAGWTYGDLDGVYPGEPFEIENAGVLTVVEPPCVPVDIVAISTTISDCVVDFAGDLTGDAPFTYLWTFGDGMTSTAAMPSHDYGASGTYSGTLEVWNCADGYDIEPFVVSVSCEVAYTIYLPLITKGYTP
jgi:uncharacterized repeat protein (TIGR01451 family)